MAAHAQSSNTLACSACTFVNPTGRATCRMCSTPMGNSRSQARTTGPPWTCSACTFINDGVASQCIVCQQPRPAPTALATPPSAPTPVRAPSQPPAPISTPPLSLSTTAHPPSNSGRHSRSRHSNPSHPPPHLMQDPHSDDDDDYYDEGGGEDDDDDGAYQPPPPSSAPAASAMSDEKAQSLYPVFVDVCTVYRASQPHPTKSKSTPPVNPEPARVSALVSRVYELIAVDKPKTAETPVPAPAAAAVSAKARPRGRSKQRRTEVVCEVCYGPIAQVPVDGSEESKSADGAEVALIMPGCGHAHVCNGCLAAYLTSRISSNDVAAWIPCPHPNCSQPVAPAVLVYPSLMLSTTLLLLLQSFLIKSLSRCTAFIPCTTSLCPYAFFSLGSAAVKLSCPLCRQEQTVQRGKVEELDPTFKAMINAGTLRSCPACNHWTMKEKGICNVLECAKCGVWWNWRTRDTGRSGQELKERARQMGTLWEHGELQYQMALQHGNPVEFKALLERNGILYDRNYRRGG